MAKRFIKRGLPHVCQDGCPNCEQLRIGHVRLDCRDPAGFLDGCGKVSRRAPLTRSYESTVPQVAGFDVEAQDGERAARTVYAAHWSLRVDLPCPILRQDGAHVAVSTCGVARRQEEAQRKYHRQLAGTR